MNSIIENETEKYLEHKSTIVTRENLHLMPQWVQDNFHFFETGDDQIYFPEKYYSVQRMHVHRVLKELFEKHPEKTANEAAARIVSHLPDFIPEDKVLELAKFALETWRKFKQTEFAPAS